MYIAKSQGGVGISSGYIRYDKGQKIDMPKGTFDHCPDLVWVADKKTKKG